MPSVALDSGPAYALFDKDDAHHRRATAFLMTIKPFELVTTVAVVTEVTYMIGRRAPLFLDWVIGTVTVDGQTGPDLPLISEFLRKYKDARPDFTDASLIVLCERLKLNRIATVDSDFDFYRTRGGRRLRNVF